MVIKERGNRKCLKQNRDEIFHISEMNTQKKYIEKMEIIVR